ncbi:hypothetical protein F5Y13DRAFT_102680 [Hypoxylon sp. FL1857]|nr:hypothetical protein F5Y13DRAFT_102680 [Hypoxylon sp. FL1857]
MASQIWIHSIIKEVDDNESMRTHFRFACSMIQNPIVQPLIAHATTQLEWGTTMFWCYMMTRAIFIDGNWLVAPEMPPTTHPADRRRVDEIVSFLTKDRPLHIMFNESKHAKASTRDITEAESQCFTACCAYMFSIAQGGVWGMTRFGTKCRLWLYYYNDEYLRPFYPSGSSLGEKDEYVNFDDPNLIKSLIYIKNHPIPAKELKHITCISPRPATVQLSKEFEEPGVASPQPSEHPPPPTDPVEIPEEFILKSNAFLPVPAELILKSQGDVDVQMENE